MNDWPPFGIDPDLPVNQQHIDDESNDDELKASDEKEI